MTDKITVHRSPSQVVILSHSRAGAGYSLLFQIGFFVLWYWILLGQQNKGWVHILFLLLPLLSIPQMVKLLRTYLGGLTYSFDPSTRTIKKNEERIARFEEVERIQIRTIHSEGANEYRLALVLRSDRKIPLAQTTSEEQVMQAADEIGDLLGVSVHRKQ